VVEERIRILSSASAPIHIVYWNRPLILVYGRRGRAGFDHAAIAKGGRGMQGGREGGSEKERGFEERGHLRARMPVPALESPRQGARPPPAHGSAAHTRKSLLPVWRGERRRERGRERGEGGGRERVRTHARQREREENSRYRR
jgi:hypothetical protein